jgi:hypothetical protein
MTFTGFRALEQSGERRHRSVHAGNQVGGGRAHFLRRALCFTRQVHHAAVAFGDQVVAREVLACAGEPEARQRHEHEIGLDRLQRRVVDAELCCTRPTRLTMTTSAFLTMSCRTLRPAALL